MAKLEWDATGSRKYEMGVTKCALYVYDNENEEYGTGVAWNGVTSISESPEGGDATDLWADDMKYASFRSLEKFGGTIEAYTYPDEFAECDGTIEPEDGVFFGQQARKKFGLCYRTALGSDTQSDTSVDYKLHLIYGCTASPSERQFQSINDSPEAITFSWQFDTDPVSAGANRKAVSCVTIDSTKVTTKANLTALENYLYGTSSAEPKFPTPEEVLNFIKTGIRTDSGEIG